MILIAGLLIAVLLVGLALVVNGAIYTENLSSREVEGSSQALADDPPTTERLTRSMREANYNSDTASYVERRSAIRQNVSTWDQHQVASSVQNGRFASSEVAAMQNGTRVIQSDTNDFMPAGNDLDQELIDTTLDPFGITGRTSWLVVPDANTRAFNMTVEKDSLKTVDGGLLDDLTNLLSTILTGNDVFWVQFDDGSSVWRVYLVEADNKVTAVITEDDGSEDVVGVCQISGTQASIRFGKNELVSGQDTQACSELSFTEEIGKHDMYFVGGNNAQGTYQIIIGEHEDDFQNKIEDEYDDFIGDLLDSLTCWTGVLGSCDDDVYRSSPTPDGPYTTTAVYDTSVEMTYQTDRMRFTRNLTVAPESSGLP
ncbi:hypothetical protein GJ631_08635 [Natronomonas sp. CBA1123]|uniref:hypothetical protein n=1 Tax=Natronomonas sp. CBA1123 TaxID=2668070 RepID=UPI0012EA66D9|nr:hypothetical protein [Natronomonas sp. CBA1123]MUV86630.1 hypothetical protein [Natronomonas sp. CBA1123]